MVTQFKFDWKARNPKGKDIVFEAGYFLLKPSFRVTGQVAPAGRKKVREGIGVSSSSVDRSVEVQLDDQLKVKVRSKIENVTLETIFEAFRNPSNDPGKQIFGALAKSIGLEVGHTAELGDFATSEVTGGFEASERTTPAFVSSKWSIKSKIELPEPSEFAAMLEGRLYIGLSKRGCEAVVQRLGREAVEQYLKRGGAQLARLGTWFVTSGALATTAIAVGAIGGTFLLVSLAAYATSDARRRGTIAGLEAWYVSAYSAKVFAQPRPSGYVLIDTIPNAAEIAGQAVLAGERDAVADARNAAQNIFHDEDYASVPDDLILRRHRARLERGAGSTASARHYLRQELQPRAQRVLGLR